SELAAHPLHSRGADGRPATKAPTGGLMSTSSKILVGGLVALNLALVGLLLFRDSSLSRARAQDSTQPAAAAIAPAPAPAAPALAAARVALAERQGGTAFAETAVAVPPATRTAATTAAPPATGPETVAADEDDRDTEPVYRDEPA